MSRPRPILCTYGRHSANFAPVLASVRAAAQRVGSPSMIDPKTKSLAVPIAYADLVTAALWAAGLRVDEIFAVTR